jgi:ribosomal protein S18 acetylase RimI-like enzyme
MIGRQIRDFRAKAREAGPAFAIYRSLQLIAPRLFRVDRFTVFERPLDATPPRQARSGVRWATRADLGLLESLGQPVRVLEGRLARRDRACIHVQDGKLLAYVWFSSDAYDDVGLCFALARDEVWLHDAKVAPEYRGRGYLPQLLEIAFADLAEEGNVRVLLSVDDLNGNALRMFARVGARPLSRFLVVRGGRLSLVRTRRGSDVEWRRFLRRFDVARKLYAPLHRD